MLSVHDLQRIASTMDLAGFERQLGPFVLVQRPPDAVTQQRALALGAQRTISRPHQPVDAFSLLFELEDLLIVTLPPIEPEQTLTVGRLPDCEVVIDDPSVSKHHAKLSWSALERSVILDDLGSSNGTWVNGIPISAPRSVQDGDELTFGDARYCLLHTSTLHSRLSHGRFRGK